ncbi:hypothetical protein ACVOMS_29840 [Bradyrhizobium guangxiense]
MLDDARAIFRLALLQFFPERDKAGLGHRNLFHFFSRPSAARPTKPWGAATLIRRYSRGLTRAQREVHVGLAPEQNNHMAGQFLRPLWLHCQSLNGGFTAASDQVSEK